MLPVAGTRAPVVGARGLAEPRRAREPAAGLDRPDQLSALSLALAAVGVLRPSSSSAPLTLLERELDHCSLSVLLAWAHLSVRRKAVPLRPCRARARWSRCAPAWYWSRVAGGVVVSGMALTFACRRKSAQWPMCRRRSASGGFTNACSISASEMAFADDCVDRDRRPLVLVWGDSTAGALMPGLRKAQETRNFGIAQFTSAPASRPERRHREHAELPRQQRQGAGARPRAPARHRAAARTWEKHLDNVAETVTALKKHTGARVVVLGSVPCVEARPAQRSASLLHAASHASFRSGRRSPRNPMAYDASCATRLVPLGAEFISASGHPVQCRGLPDAHRRQRGRYHRKRPGASHRKRLGISDRVRSSTACSGAGVAQATLFTSAPVRRQVQSAPVQALRRVGHLA